MLSKDVILFHDVESNSGFQTPRAFKYKITPKIFWRLIDEFKNLDRENRPILTFDDGGNSVNIELLEQLLPFFKIILFIPTNYIGRPGFLREIDIRALHDYGVLIGSHSHNHSVGKELGSSEFLKDWSKSKDILEGIISSKIDCCSIPFGKYHVDQLPMLHSLGFTKIYTSDNEAFLFDSDNYFETVPRMAIDSRFLPMEIWFLKFLGMSYLRFRSRIISILFRCH